MEHFKNYEEFVKKIKEHMAKYNPGPAGYFPRFKVRLPHILDIPPGKTKLEVIQAIIDRDSIPTDMFNSPHIYAHHLNSSQVVCYEFFRNMVEHNQELSPEMLKCLSRMGLPSDLYKGGKAHFEYVPYPEENTNFDFFIEQPESGAKVYFEVKYTEYGFGGCKKDDEHKTKFDSVYKNMIADCACLKKEPKFDDDWRKYYQLFRNILRITKSNWEKEYVVFLFPEENYIARRQFEAFKEMYIKEEFNNRIKSVFWEQMTDFMSDEFRTKFFFYTLD